MTAIEFIKTLTKAQKDTILTDIFNNYREGVVLTVQDEQDALKDLFEDYNSEGWSFSEALILLTPPSTTSNQ